MKRTRVRREKMKIRSLDRGPPSLNLLWAQELIGKEKLLWISIRMGQKLQGSQVLQQQETRGSGFRRNGPFHLELKMVFPQLLLT